jgi:Domain of unknown function (DUF1918)
LTRICRVRNSERALSQAIEGMMSEIGSSARFQPGHRICARRSGHSAADSLAEVLEAFASDGTEVYRVRWQYGGETFFVPGPQVQERRRRDVGPPADLRERRR